MKTEINKAWALAVNDKENYPFKDPMYGNKLKGKINIDHYITYNIVRGLPLDRGFNNPDNYDFKVYTYKLNSIAKNEICWHSKSFLDSCLFPFNELINEDEFKEMANEALRLYSGS